MILENQYSKFDRLLHRLAFSSIEIQKVVADIEDHIYSKRFINIKIDRPVFITSLPRAGTTLLLDLISDVDDFAAHTYREMPFLLTPLLWSSISHSFRKVETSYERAHGDGMSVGYDSVEAFEEILWRAFWKEKYTKSHIIPWKADDIDISEEFVPFFKNHIRKLLALRSNGERQPGRYISKNNANVSRTAKIVRIFPDAVILIPFRSPLDHVGSMLRQHKNFQKIHEEDEFARRYMEDIGHFDFGANFRPINFNGWFDRENPDVVQTTDFWLKYWCATFEYLISNPLNNQFFISYERCCEKPAEALRQIALTTGLNRVDDLVVQAHRFRAPVAYDSEKLGLSHDLLERAMSLYAKLLDASII